MTTDEIIEWINENAPADVRLWVGDKVRRLAFGNGSCQDSQPSDTKAAVNTNGIFPNEHEVCECEMCGNFFLEDRINLVTDLDGNDREICNSCFHNSGF